MALIEFKNLPDTSTPITAENLNKIQEGNIYSTDEIEIGKWIDNSLIYKKVVNCGNMPNASSKTISTGLTNVNYIDFSGIAIASGGSASYPYKMGNTGNFILRIDNNNIIITTVSDVSAYIGYVTILYTKN